MREPNRQKAQVLPTNRAIFIRHGPTTHYNEATDVHGTSTVRMFDLQVSGFGNRKSPGLTRSTDNVASNAMK
jgi:hypothetical protein